MLPDAAHAIGAIPAAFLLALSIGGRKVDAAYWWLAAAFGVSFVADYAAHWADPALVSQVYLVTQAALFAAVLIPSRPVVEWAVWVLLFTASLSVVARQGEGLDVLLHVVAFGSVSALAWMLARGRLRLVLGVGFACLALAWCGYVWRPSFVTWGAYHAVRLAMATGFCWSVSTDERRRHGVS